MQQLSPATPRRFLPTILCRILRPTFSPLEPDCYPTRTSPQIEMVLLTGNVGILCADWPSKAIFYCMWSSVGDGRREKSRKCDMVKESRRGKIPSYPFFFSLHSLSDVHVLVFMFGCSAFVHCKTQKQTNKYII